MLRKKDNKRRKRGPSNLQEIRRRWLSALQWIGLSIIPARIALITFIGHDGASWVISALGALFLGIGLARLFHLREEQMLLIQYQHLLGYLSTRLAAGVPLEAAFSESVLPLREQLGRHNSIVRSLMGLKKNLESQVSLGEALSAFTRELGLPVCQRDFTMLIMLARTGGRIDVFIRQSHHDLSAQINARNEVANERRGHSSEALILAIIPFFMAHFILSNTSSYSQPLQETASMLWPLNLLYLAAMLALFILLFLLAPEKTRTGRRKKKAKKELPPKPATDNLFSNWLSRLYLDWLPGQIGMTLSGAVHQLAAEPENAWQNYMGQKLRDILSGFLLAGLFALSGRVSLFLTILTPFAFSTLRDIGLCNKAARQKEQYRFFYPSVVNSLHILLESGLTLNRSLRMVALVNRADAKPDNPVAIALGQAALLLETGYDGVMAVGRLAERCPLPEVQAALRLMARYEREGGREILELVRMQSDRSRQLYRDALRGRAEQRSLLYVIPMAIDLLVVMATVILPAVASLQLYI